MKVVFLTMITFGLSIVAISGQNIALGKRTAQSSNYLGNQGLSSRAVDGNTNGRYFSGSVTHTRYGTAGGSANPWWEVDLGADFRVNTIQIWNRSDCCAERLDNFIILVKSSRKKSRWKRFVPDYQRFRKGQRYPLTYQSNKLARFVRIQIAKSRAILSLAEVKIYGNRYVPPRNAEERCFDLVQGHVPWNKAGNRNWVPSNIRVLCMGTTNPQGRVACFSAWLNANRKMGEAIRTCLSDSSSRPGRPRCERPAATRAGFKWNYSTCNWVRVPRPQPQPVYPAPSLRLPNPGQILRNYPRSLTFSWNRVPGAIAYHIDVQYSDSGSWRSLVSKRVAGTQLRASMIGDGAARWRVRTFGPINAAGPASRWRGFSFNTRAITQAPKQIITTAPRQISPRSSAQISGTRNVRFVWQGVRGATRYIVETQVLQGTWGTHQVKAAFGTSITIAFPSGIKGRWRVGSIGSNNVGGGKSNWWYFDMNNTGLQRAPRQFGPRSGEQIRSSTPFSGKVKFVWERMSGAKRYLIEIQINKGRGWVNHSSRSLSPGNTHPSSEIWETRFPLNDLGRWRIGAIGQNGVNWKKSTWSTFKVFYKLFEEE